MCEYLALILKRFKLQRIATWIKEEHRSLLTHLPFKSNVRLNDKAYVFSFQYSWGSVRINKL